MCVIADYSTCNSPHWGMGFAIAGGSRSNIYDVVYTGSHYCPAAYTIVGAQVGVSVAASRSNIRPWYGRLVLELAVHYYGVARGKIVENMWTIRRPYAVSGSGVWQGYIVKEKLPGPGAVCLEGKNGQSTCWRSIQGVADEFVSLGTVVLGHPSLGASVLVSDPDYGLDRRGLVALVTRKGSGLASLWMATGDQFNSRFGLVCGGSSPRTRALFSG